jgi:hypothetical protein
LSGLLFGLVKVGFLAVLWLFVLLIGNIIRTDLFGRRTSQDELSKLAHEGGPNPKRRGPRAKELAQLVVIAGQAVGDSVPLQGEITLGRAADSTLDIEDDYASSHHARLYRDAESWILADLGSTNGTYINGVRIERPTRIGAEDIIRIGRTQLKLEP